MSDDQPATTSETIAPVPTAIVYPTASNSSSMVPPELLQVMSANPTEAMSLVKDLVAQEYALRNKEADYRQNLELDKNNRQANSDRATKNNLRILIAALLSAFLAALGYGVVVKDSSLADKVFTGAMGILGGGGGVALLNKKSEGK